MGVTALSTKVMDALTLHGRAVRFGSQMALDAAAWAIAIVLAVSLRYDLDLTQISARPLVVLIVFAAVLQCLFGWVLYVYRGRHPYGSFADLRALLWATVATAVVLGIPVLGLGTEIGIPRSAIALAAPFAFVMMGAVRYLKRLLVDIAVRPGGAAERTLVYGAGYLGAGMIRRMVSDRQSTYLPVGLIEDDPRKRSIWFEGVRVLGDRTQLTRIVEETRATLLIVAIGRADAALLREISDAASAAGLRVKVLPLLNEILEGHSRLRDLRDLSIEDLIGRHPVDTQFESVAGYLSGKTILVTGAGGSIGAELCRQIVKFGPSDLIMLDRDETGLQQAQISISGHGLLDTRDVVLADIRDVDALRAIFEDRRPDVVFHAAALKHLPMLEQYPEEAWKTNVLGTLNVLEAAMAAGVTTFINISTDKAARPTSILGHSKRVAEKLTAWAAESSGQRYLSVRFGNVIGSRGSMLPTFTSLIEAGGPLTITHPDVTRFFMTIPEACQLVVQAGGIGRRAEVLILDMGEPVRIVDIAERMIEMSGKDIEIVVTGLRPGEKLHEILIGDGEVDNRPIHPKISHAKVDSLRPEHLDKVKWLERCRIENDGRDHATSMIGS